MPSFSKLALPVLGSLLISAGGPHVFRAAQAQSAPPRLIAQEIRHAQSDFATGGVRRLSASWFACTDAARSSQDANTAERCVIYGDTALLLQNAGGADGTEWMRYLRPGLMAAGQDEMAAIMGIPAGARQGWLDRYQRWVAESYDGAPRSPAVVSADPAMTDADGPDQAAPREVPPQWEAAPGYGGPAPRDGYGAAPYGNEAYGSGDPYHGPPYGQPRPSAEAPRYDAGRYGGWRAGSPWGAAGPAGYGGDTATQNVGTPRDLPEPADGPYDGVRNAGGPFASPARPTGARPFTPSGYDGGRSRPDRATDLARIADGKYPREAMRQPDIADALRQAVGATVFAHLKDYGFASPMQFTGRYTVGIACEPRSCGLAEARFVIAANAAWVAIVKNGRLRIYGNPPRPVRAVLLRDRNETVWRGPVEEVARPMPAQVIEAAAEGPRPLLAPHPYPVATEPVPGGPPRLTIASHPYPVATEPVPGGPPRLTIASHPYPVATEPMPGGPPRLTIASHPYPVATGPVPGGPPRLTIAPHPFPVSAAAPPSSIPEGDVTEVRLSRRDGTFEVPVTINGAMTLSFAIDSGSSDVSVSADVMRRLIQAGTVSQADFLGKRTYDLADGSSVSNETFRIHVLRVGDREVHDVLGSVTNDANSLLLGQSFLRRFRSWSIDNQRQVLVLQ